MESWSTFTDDAVFGVSLKERQGIAAVKGRDDLADICDAVTTQIREAWQGGGRSPGPDDAIPDSLKARAIAIATWRFVSEGVPRNEGVQTKARYDAFTEAVNYLEQIARREIKSAGSAQSINPLERQATRQRLDGLI
jgi:hypothetical protein